MIDQDGREIPAEIAGAGVSRLPVRFRHSTANPFANLTREQRLARLEAMAKLLDVAFILPGTNIRYGIDGIIRLDPGGRRHHRHRALAVAGARGARARRALACHGADAGQCRVRGRGRVVPVAGDAFDVLFRANMRNMRLLRRWLDKQPR